MLIAVVQNTQHRRKSAAVTHPTQMATVTCLQIDRSSCSEVWDELASKSKLGYLGDCPDELHLTFQISFFSEN